MRFFSQKIALSIAFAGLILVSLGFVTILKKNPRDVASAISHEIDEVAKPSIVFDRDGRRLGAFSDDARYPVHLSDIPLHVQRAFIAAEDESFYEHHGVSWRGVFRSVWVNLRRERLAQGGSTITQQLVRQYLLTREKSWTRKIRELDLAIRLEHQLNKKQILELWLNGVYLGNNAWGIEAASQNYFKKSTHDLTVGEAAVLAGLPKAPSMYAPHIHPEKSRVRKKYVLSRMAAAGWLTAADAKKYSDEKVTVYKDRKQVESTAPWVTEAARIELWRRLEMRHLPRSGWSIATHIDREWQWTAQRLFAKELAQFRGSGLEAAMVAVDIPTGQVRTVIGGVDFATSQFNRATQLSRPFGSATFPLIFAWATDAGITSLSSSQSLGATAIMSQFLDADRVAATLGYGVVRDHFLQASLAMKKSIAIEDVQGSPLALAQAWRQLSGLPIQQSTTIVRGVRSPTGVAEFEQERQPVLPGVSESAAYSVRSWLALGGATGRVGERVRFKADHSWNHWEIAVSDQTIVALWAGADRRPTKDPDLFRSLKEKSASVLDRWLVATGNVVKRPQSPVPVGISWQILRDGQGRMQRVPFPTSAQ